ncbi:MAG TPA: anion transporter [Candidatus Polarisedimenticolaceae bacterium]|nr:anion transporter [Candidatus Polarisedimenticolaceae bacterium]
MATAALIFALTYVVIALQGLPRLRLDRASGALLGAVAMVACGVLDFDAALAAIDLDTILFLLGMMIVLAYLELSGFFQVIERRLLGFARSARGLLVWVVGTAGVLSAVFMNDTVCLMLAPVVVRVTRRLSLPPVPYLLGLALAANVGSACTILGNPQNAWIGVRSGLGLLPFTGALWPVSAAGLALCCAVLLVLYRKALPRGLRPVPPPRAPQAIERGLLVSGLLAGIGLLVLLAAGVRPAAAAMAAAAAVVVAGAARPRTVLREVDWPLLLFFAGLFVVMRGVEHAGLARRALEATSASLHGADASALGTLAVAVTALSQAVSNVPAVLLFGPSLAIAPAAVASTLWLALAAFSTLAGNLTILASAANVIVVESARREGLRIGFLEHLAAGLPVTVGTLLLAWVWLLVRAA